MFSQDNFLLRVNASLNRIAAGAEKSILRDNFLPRGSRNNRTRKNKNKCRKLASDPLSVILENRGFFIIGALLCIQLLGLMLKYLIDGSFVGINHHNSPYRHVSLTDFLSLI